MLNVADVLSSASYEDLTRLVNLVFRHMDSAERNHHITYTFGDRANKQTLINACLLAFTTRSEKEVMDMLYSVGLLR